MIIGPCLQSLNTSTLDLFLLLFQKHANKEDIDHWRKVGSTYWAAGLRDMSRHLFTAGTSVPPEGLLIELSASTYL